jgi:hypothetical protein
MYVNIKMQVRVPLMDEDKLTELYKVFIDELEMLSYTVIRDQEIDALSIGILVEGGDCSWKLKPRKQPKKKSRNNVAMEQQAA